MKNISLRWTWLKRNASERSSESSKIWLEVSVERTTKKRKISKNHADGNRSQGRRKEVDGACLADQVRWAGPSCCCCCYCCNHYVACSCFSGKGRRERQRAGGGRGRGAGGRRLLLSLSITFTEREKSTTTPTPSRLNCAVGASLCCCVWQHRNTLT